MPSSSVRELWRRMRFSQSPVTPVLTVVLSGFVALAAYFWSVVDKLHLPITPGLPIAATFLPAVTFIGIQYITGGGRRGQSRPAWSLQIGIISMLLIILDTVIVTQSINNMPKSAISCPLEGKWREFYRAKDAKSIRGIQDAFDCCGLRSFKDQAWPFPGGPNNNTAETCSTTYGRKNSCFDPWSHMHQLSAGMFMTVAVVSFLSKGIIFLVYRTYNRSQSPNTRRLLGDNTTNGTQNNGTGYGGTAVGPRIRPDERARPIENDDDDIESVVNENARLLEDSDRPVHYDTSTPARSDRVPVLTDVDGGVWDNETSRAHPQR